MARTLKRIKEALRRRQHGNVHATARWLGRVIGGWLNYYAVPDSYRYLARFVRRLKRMWLTVLRRRSQKDRFNWARINALSITYWPAVKIRHPWPRHRLAVKRNNTRPKGGAGCLGGHVRICAGGAG